MAESNWHIVRDYDRSRVVGVYVVCPDCWPEHVHLKDSPAEGIRVELREVPPSTLHHQEECHYCERTPRREPPQEDAHALGRV